MASQITKFLRLLKKDNSNDITIVNGNGNTTVRHGITSDILNLLNSSSYAPNAETNNPANIATVATVINKLAFTMAKLPIHLYSETKEKGKVKQVDNNLYWLIHSKPNNYSNTANLITQIVYQLCTHGNSYLYIQRDELLNPVSIDLIPVDTFEVMEVFKGIEIYYKTSDGRVVNGKNLLHFKWPSAQIKGNNPIEALRLSLSIGQNALGQISNSYANGLFQRFYLKTLPGFDSSITKKQKQDQTNPLLLLHQVLN